MQENSTNQSISRLWTTGPTTKVQFIGFTIQGVTKGSIANIAIGGYVLNGFQNLTPTARYYVRGNGTISTIPDMNGIYAGSALSNSQLLIGAS